MKRTIFFTLITMAVISCVCSCKQWAQKEETQVEIKEENVVNTDTCDIDSTAYHSILGYFDEDSANLLEVYFEQYAGGTEHNGVITKIISLGPKTGEAEIQIKNWKGSLVYNKKTFLLLDNHKDSLIAIKAMDLDGDGEKEIVAHDGEEAFIFQMRKNQPHFCGQIPSNFGFWVMNDYTIVSRIGSQGIATLSKFKDGKLTAPQDTIIDKMMWESDDYKNLRYDFHEQTNSNISPLLEVDHYAINQKRTAVYRDDIDGDGADEQVIYYFSPFATDASDRIALICDNNSIDLFEKIIEAKDSTGLGLYDYESKVKSPIQFTALEVDGDNRKEVIVTIGDRSANSSYVFKLNDDRKSVTLVKHLKLKNEVPTVDMMCQSSDDIN